MSFHGHRNAGRSARSAPLLRNRNLPGRGTETRGAGFRPRPSPSDASSRATLSSKSPWNFSERSVLAAATPSNWTPPAPPQAFRPRRVARTRVPEWSLLPRKCRTSGLGFGGSERSYFLLALFVQSRARTRVERPPGLGRVGWRIRKEAVSGREASSVS